MEGINLLDPACKVEFVITVQALKEGWDCSFAYMFCSLATVHSKKDLQQVKRWVRHVVGMFGLPTATGTCYPDFFAELNDGRVLLIEYKGEHLIEDELQKKNIGERWEETSKGEALFLWAVKKDEHGRDVHRQLQDKLAKS